MYAFLSCGLVTRHVLPLGVACDMLVSIIFLGTMLLQKKKKHVINNNLH